MKGNKTLAELIYENPFASLDIIAGCFRSDYSNAVIELARMKPVGCLDLERSRKLMRDLIRGVGRADAFKAAVSNLDEARKIVKENL
jgi:hypothetical protein